MDQFLSYVALTVIAMGVFHALDTGLVRFARVRRPARARPIQRSARSKA